MQPVVGHSPHPLAPLRPVDMRVVLPGTMLLDTRPECVGVVVPRLNGDWLLPDEYVRPLREGDVLEWHEVPQDKAALRTVLSVAVIAVAAWINPALAAQLGSTMGTVATAAFTVAGQLLINALLPLEKPLQVEQSGASQTYTTGLSGNRAKPFDPVPKICGRHQTFPPYAAQPYTRFDEYRMQGDKEVGGDQYFHALFAIDVGDPELERVLIDDTPIAHFADVLTARYLPPGTMPTDVRSNVVTSVEVAGQELQTGRYVGGFAACGPTHRVKAIEYDIACPTGLGASEDDGTWTALAVEWRVEVRPVDDFGNPVDLWKPAQQVRKVDNKPDPRRWSFSFDLEGEPRRVEVRLVRLDQKDTRQRAVNELVWTSLRAVLEKVAPLNPNVSHFEVVMRASEQLSTISQGRLSVIARAKAQPWLDGYHFGPPVHTRNPAWWCVEIARNPVWGLGLPESRIDLDTFAELAAIADARQDRFDYVFDSTMDGWSAIQMVARTMRCRAFRRNGVLTAARDQWETLPVTAFTHRNATAMAMTEALPTRDWPDGIIVEYFSYKSWDWETVECPCPGSSGMSNPKRVRLPGITGPAHAKREGLYEAASMRLRTRTVSCVTEMEGVLPAFMSPVRWLPEYATFGQTGDVEEWDGDVTLRLSEPVRASDGPPVLVLIRPDGTPTDPVDVTAGPTAYHVVLSQAPDFEVVAGDAMRERTKFLLGVKGRADELVKISAIGDGGMSDDGALLFNIEAVVDDIRVHQADNEYLPKPGEVQDAVTEPVPEAAQVFINLVPNIDGWVHNVGRFLNQQKFYPNGRQSVLVQIDPPIEVDMGGQWALGWPIEPTTAARFEIRAVPDSQSRFDDSSSPLNVWLNLADGPYAWAAPRDTQGSIDSFMTVSIREASTGVVQDSAFYKLRFSGNGTPTQND